MNTPNPVPCRLCREVPIIPDLYSEGYAITSSFTLRCSCGVAVSLSGSGRTATLKPDEVGVVTGHVVASRIAEGMRDEAIGKWNRLMAT